jgi:hypothetical protein
VKHGVSCNDKSGWRIAPASRFDAHLIVRRWGTRPQIPAHDLRSFSCYRWFKEFDADSFLANFCARYFGADCGAEAADLYRACYLAYLDEKAARPRHAAAIEQQWQLGDGYSRRRCRPGALDSTQHGPFNAWYASERLFGLASLQARLKSGLRRSD